MRKERSGSRSLYILAYIFAYGTRFKSIAAKLRLSQQRSLPFWSNVRLPISFPLPFSQGRVLVVHSVSVMLIPHIEAHEA